MTLAALFLLAATYTRSMERVASIDPIRAQSVYDSCVVQLLYSTPLEVDYAARPYRLIPGVCELPEVSADGLTYLFKMATSSLTAEDVVRSLERLRDPANAAPGGWILKGVKSIRVCDEKTVEIVLKERSHVFPWMMAMSSAAVRRADGSGTGEYVLESWRKNYEMVFRRRVPVADGFNTIRYLTIGDVSTQWLMFLRGELDYLGSVSRDNWDAVVTPDGQLAPELSRKGVVLHAVPTMDVYYIGFNMRDKTVGVNKKLRQALSCAFDFPTWRKFNNNRIDPATGPIPPGVDGRLETPHPYEFNLERAKALLAEAGYVNGIDPATGRRLVLELAIGRATQDSRELGELMASFFARIGVKLELSFNTWSAFLRAVNEGRVQMFMLGWVGDYPDAENFLQLFHSKNKSPGANHSDYENPAFDAAFDAAMACTNAVERNVYWKQCQEIVREDCPWIFMHTPKAHVLMHKRVKNYIPGNFPYGQEKHFKRGDEEK